MNVRPRTCIHRTHLMPTRNALSFRLVVLLLMAGVLSTKVVLAQTASVRGFIIDESDGQPLQGVNVGLEDATGALRGAVTDDDGFFIVIRLAPGRYVLRASFIGYETTRDTLNLEPGGTITRRLIMRPGEAALGEVVVEADREGGATVSAGLQTVRPKDIDLIPTPDVSGDLVTYLSTMPGVISLGDRGGQIFIRGGEPSHNLTLLDGMYVYQPFHILGFYSAFSSDILRNADIYAGGFSSKYSGRMSSVIDVHTRNGNNQAFRRTLSLAPFVNLFILEGPIKKDRISFLGSYRASTIERFASKYVNQPLPYSFGDIFGKLHAVINQSHQLSFSYLHTYDRGTLDSDAEASAAEEIRWKNTAYGIRYLVAPPSLPILGEFLFSISRLETSLGPPEAPRRTSDINGFNVAVNVTNFGRRSQVDWGFFLRAPELSAELGGLFQNLDFSFNRATTVGGYFEPDIDVGQGVRVRPGLVVQFLGEQGTVLEPRLRLTWERGSHQVSAAVGLYRQDVIGLIDRRDATNIFTAWTDSPTGAVPKAAHVLLGYRVTPTPWLRLSVEGYYKDLSRLFISEWTAFPRFTTRLQEASGRAVGLDLRLEIQRPSFYAFINYGLSSVEYEAMQEALLVWFGQESITFRPPHDRRHQLNALARASVFGFDVSARWNYGSGLPYNQVRGFDGFILLDGPIDLSEERGTARVIYDRPYGGILPSYHRLDVSVERVFLSGKTVVTLQGGVINVYDRANLFALDLFTLRRTNQLPLIPTVGIKFEF